MLAGHCEKAGRDPAEIERVWGVRDDLLEHAEGLHAAGVDTLTIGIGGDGSGYDLGPLRELLSWRDGLRED